MNHKHGVALAVALGLLLCSVAKAAEEEGELEEEVAQAPVAQPKVFFDENGKYLLPHTTPEQKKLFNHHKYRRKLYTDGRIIPQPKSIRAYGLQNYFNNQ